MLIAVIFEAFPSPSETFLRRELEALRARGLDARPFAWRAGEGALALPPSSSLSSRLMRRARGEAWWHAQGAQWARDWKRQGFAINHIHAAWASFPAAWARGAAGEMGVPWSFSAHARDLWVEGGDLRGKLGSAAFATACTRAGAERLRQLSSCPERVLYAPHGLPLGEWPQRDWRAYDPTRELRILSVGRLVPKKGLDILLRALALWQQQAPGERWTATIIGEGPQRARLERLRAGLKLEGRVHMPGALEVEAVRDEMRRSDVFVLPCRVTRDGDRDGLPNVLLEAAAIGVPLVVGDAGSVRDLCDDAEGSRSAWLFPPHDAGALKYLLRQAWAQLQPANNSWQQASERARLSVERGFDIARNIHVLADALAHGSSS